MPDRRLDASALRDWAHTAVGDLITHTDEINRLNVFPVADSDTGTNMLFTMRSALAEANSAARSGEVAQVAAALSEGALHGARGNSGVILSQILRGLADVTAAADADRQGALADIDAPLLGAALRHAVRLAVASMGGEMVAGTIVSVLQAAADAQAVDALVQGVDAIVHLGGVSVEGPFAPILQANIIGVVNLYEAARRHGVRRVVFASSNHVTGFYRQDETIDASAPPRPDGFYGLSKAFGEDVARLYFDRFGIETACVRIGSSFPEPRDRRMLATWLSYDDLHRLVTAALTTPALGYTIIFGMSNNAVTWWDNRCARHVGYQPADSSDRFRDNVYARTTAPDLSDPAAVYQGGAFVRTGPLAS